MNSTLPNEEWSEPADSEADFKKDEVKQHIQRYPSGQVEFVDAYCKVKAHILFRLRGRDGQEFFSCVQRDWRILRELDDIFNPGGSFDGDDFRGRTIWRRHLIWSESLRRVYDAHGQEKTMLVDYVQSVEFPKEEIPSLVWTDTVERFESFLPKTWYKSVQLGFVSLGIGSNRELSIMSGDFRQAASKIIQSTTEAIENIAGKEWDAARQDRQLLDVIGYVASLRISLSESGCRFRFGDVSEHGVELLDVLFGPIVLV